MHVWLTAPLLVSALSGTASKCGTIYYDRMPFPNCSTASSVFVSNSETTTLEHLNSLKTIAPPTDPSHAAIYNSPLWIENNPNLVYEEANFLPRLKSITRTRDSHALAVIIRNNPNLCIPDHFKENLRRMSDNMTSIQKCACFTNGSSHTVIGGVKSLTKIFPPVGRCQVFTSSLDITGFVPLKILERLETVEEIEGRLLIAETNVTNLNFLANLEHIKAKGQEPLLRIENNRRLESIFLRNLRHLRQEENKYAEELIRIWDNENLRLSYEEEKKLLLIDSESDSAEISLYDYRSHCQLPLCPSPIEQDGVIPTVSPREIVNSELTCEKQLWSAIESVCNDKVSGCLVREDFHKKDYGAYANCRCLKGNVTFKGSLGTGRGLRENMSGIVSVEGTLEVRNTDLQDLSFLPLLRTIIFEERALVIENNAQMRTMDLQLHNLTKKGNRTTPPVLIRNNSRLCEGESDFLLDLLRSSGQTSVRVEYLKGEKGNCHETRTHSRLWLVLLPVAGGIVLFGSVVVFLATRRRKQDE